MSYSISALAHGETVRETRTQKTGVAVLARKWVAEGLTGVRITAGGKFYTPSAFLKYVL